MWSRPRQTFSTKVIGLVISRLGCGMGLARRILHRRDMNELEFLLEQVSAEELI